MLQLVLTWAVLLGEGINFRPVSGTRDPVLAKGLTLYAPNGIYLQPEVVVPSSRAGEAATEQ